MNFFGIGLPEMLVIFTVALLIFGPRKLPEMSRTIAKTIKSLQQASRDFEVEMNREIKAAETRPIPTPPIAALKIEETAVPDSESATPAESQVEQGEPVVS